MDSDFNITNQYLPTYKENFKGDGRWATKETEHYVFNYFADSEAEKDILSIEKRQENGFNKIIYFLGLPIPERKIWYYFYPNEQIKKELMGDDWFAQAIYKDFIVHILYTEKDKPIGEHEDTHLLSLPWGLSIALFQEGLSEYMVGKNWFGRDFNEVVKEAITKNILPSIESMIEHKKWLELDDENTIYYYSFCASFTKYLIETYGKDLYKELYMKTKRENSKEDNSNIFLDIFEKTPSEMEVLWKKWVNI